jgi:hypothetical protein
VSGYAVNHGSLTSDSFLVAGRRDFSRLLGIAFGNPRTTVLTSNVNLFTIKARIAFYCAFTLISLFIQPIDWLERKIALSLDHIQQREEHWAMLIWSAREAMFERVRFPIG